ncbi:MAG TPA: hypothetical protein VFF73_07080 [Planctomycetota bacterium]|nr:hypothetical protein [Planctomycetota bacterium]
MSWAVAAVPVKDRFALGEAIPVRIRATYRGPGQALRPDLGGGAPSAPLIELQHEGELAQVHSSAVNDPSRAQPHLQLVAAGQTVTGTLRIDEWVEELATGRYVGRIVLRDGGDASLPFVFHVEELVPLAHVTAPVDAAGGSRRTVLWLTHREEGARLLLAWPDNEEWVVHDAGETDREAKIALGVLPPDEWDRRSWVVTLEKGSLVRRFVGGEPLVTSFEPTAIGLERPLILGAAGGRREEEERRPSLHVALAGSGEVLALDFDRARGAARIARRPLPAPPLAGALVATSNGERIILVLVPGPGEAVLLAAPWGDAGLGELREVLRAKGTALSLGAVVEPGPRVRAVLLARDAREPGDLELRAAFLGTGARLAEPPRDPYWIAADRVPSGVERLELRLGPSGERRILGRLDGSAVLVAPGSKEAIALPSCDGPVELDFVGPGRVRALLLDRTRGLQASLLSPVEV